MTCKACGRDVPRVDKTCCADCYEEGPFSFAYRAAPWVRKFAWLPVRGTEGLAYGKLLWLRWVETKTYSVFGAQEHLVRVAA